MSNEDSKSYFKQTNPIVAIMVVSGMILCHLGCFNPKIVPHQYMGPIGWLYEYLVYSQPIAIQLIYFSAVAVHIAEGFYALHLSKKKGIVDTVARFKWFIQTSILGIFSLSYLIK